MTFAHTPRTPRTPRPPRPPRPPRRARRTAATALAGALMVGSLTSVGAAHAAVAVPAPVLSYSFDELAGSVAAGANIDDAAATEHDGTVVGGAATTTAGPSGNAADRALALPGGPSNSAGSHVRIAPGLLTSSAVDATMSAWVRWSGSPQCTWPFTLGSSADSHLLATTQCGSGAYGAVKSGFEVRASATAPVAASRWVHMAVVIDGGSTVSTYLDGALVGQAPTTFTAAAAVGTSSFSGYLGKSFYGPDAYWSGAIDDVQVWDQALSAAQVTQSAATVHGAIAARDAVVDLGDTSAVTSNLVLPAVAAGGSAMTWSSSNPAVLSAAGAVTRPAAGSADAVVTLTPTATHGGSPVTGTPITVTVPAYASGDSAQAELARAVAAAVRALPQFTEPVRGSIHLPVLGSELDATKSLAGAGGAAISWQSSDDDVITDTDAGAEPNVVAKGAVTRAAQPSDVTLTATVSVAGAPPVRVELPLVVPAAIDLAPTDLDAYLFVYFTGDNIEGEKLRFATSDGNDALKWKTLNDAQPILSSTKGTQGLRDPYIMRSKEGDRFFLIATDLSVGRSGWGGATDRGSHYLEIWESTDLVNWGEQRHVKVNVPKAGMTWAPEATYDPTIDAYVVYWTSSIYQNDARTQPDGNGPQIFTSITRDFRSFTEPTPWFRAADTPGLIPGNGLIDSTVLKDGDSYYRFTKASQSSGCASPDIIGQRSSTLRATTASGAWSVVDLCIGRNAGTPEVEGPSAFRANPGDVSGFTYFLWVDNYGGVGYIPLATNSLEGDIQWTYPATFSLPASPRHGSVLAITAAERDALAAAFNPSLLVTSVQPVAVNASVGATSVALPATVSATFRDGHVENVGVAWEPADLGALNEPGDTVQVRGALANSSATAAIATITATGSAVALTTKVMTRCVAGKVSLVVSVKNTATRNVDVAIATAHGSKTVPALAPGKSTLVAISVRSSSLAAGQVAVTGTAATPAGPVSTTTQTAYTAARCP